MSKRNINYKRLYLLAVKRTKNFLLSKESREFFLFLFFFIIAGGFWLLQTLNNDYEATFTVPVRLTDVPNNVVITSEPASELTIRVQDKGTVLFNYLIGNHFYPLTIPFVKSFDNSNHIRVAQSSFERNIQAQLSASSRLLSVSPDTIDYIYAAGISKRLPVRFLGSITTARQYYVPDTLFTPDSVMVYAPSTVLDTMRAAYIQSVEFTQLIDTLHEQVPLLPRRGVKYEPADVALTIPTDIYTEKSVEVPIIGVGFPAGKELRTFPSKATVTFQVGMSKFRQIRATDFQIIVPYNDLLKSSSDKYTLHLNLQPKDIKGAAIHPEEVDFLIEQALTPHAD
jgi:hypothetical protein